MQGYIIDQILFKACMIGIPYANYLYIAWMGIRYRNQVKKHNAQGV